MTESPISSHGSVAMMGQPSATSQYDLDQMRSYLREIKSRQIEALNLYEPLPWQDKFHQATVKEAILSKGNQSGGSLCGFAEVARAVTGQDPYGKYPEKNGVVVCLGYGESHIGRVMHRYLFRSGAFDIIRDLETNEWRVFRPWSSEEEFNGKRGDAGREKEARPAPPLIPKRFIKGKIAWTKRAENIFSTVYLTTGWTLYACNSVGDPNQAQGFQANLYHIDEDLASGGWYEEAVARCSRFNGLIRWTAMPHSSTEDIVRMIERAEEEEGKEKPRTICVKAGIADNPFLPKEAREENMRIWAEAGDDVVRMRAYGELTVDNVRMYPRFDKRTHSAIRTLSSRQQEEESRGIEHRSLVQKILTDNNGVPPQDWTRYFSFDPGHTVLAGVWVAVPPPQLGDFKIVYRELYITSATAAMFGSRMQDMQKSEHIQDWIVDMHGARLRSLATGELPIRDYERQMDRYKLGCEVRGSRFGAGCDDIQLRENKLREWIATRNDGYPTLLVVGDRCPNLIKEIVKFKKKKVRVGGMDVIQNEANRKGMCHAVEALEMIAAHGCPYVAPPRRVVASSRVDGILKARKLRALQRRHLKGKRPGEGGIILGPRGDQDG